MGPGPRTCSAGSPPLASCAAGARRQGLATRRPAARAPHRRPFPPILAIRAGITPMKPESSSASPYLGPRRAPEVSHRPLPATAAGTSLAGAHRENIGFPDTESMNTCFRRRVQRSWSAATGGALRLRGLHVPHALPARWGGPSTATARRSEGCAAPPPRTVCCGRHDAVRQHKYGASLHPRRTRCPLPCPRLHTIGAGRHRAGWGVGGAVGTVSPAGCCAPLTDLCATMATRCPTSCAVFTCAGPARVGRACCRGGHGTWGAAR